jgi:hypothetical protein
MHATFSFKNRQRSYADKIGKYDMNVPLNTDTGNHKTEENYS